MRIVMMGTGTFAEPTFEALLKHFPGEVVGLVTQPDRNFGRRSGSSRQIGVGMANIAKAHSLPVLQPASINSDEGLAQLAVLNPDLCVVAAYGQIFKAGALAIPKLGFVNVHASLLPKYRGAAPVAHAILNGETQTGVSIFRITTGIDTGEILATDWDDIGEGETTGELEIRLAEMGANLIVDVVNRFKLGPVSGDKQNVERATKAPKITKEMGLINWSKSARRIVNHIRAMQPWPTAYTFLHRSGQEPIRIIVQKVEGIGLDISPPRFNDPGLVRAWSASDNYIMVEAGCHDIVKIKQLQVAGRKAQTAAEFLHGHPLPESCRFGPERLS